MDWRRWASIARLTLRKMSCLNGSKKLLTQKIIRFDAKGRWGEDHESDESTRMVVEGHTEDTDCIDQGERLGGLGIARNLMRDLV